jgi:predicted phosphodiesterase
MRCLVIADLHANLVALDAVLDAPGRVDPVWCLGDVVGFGPDPDGCVDRLKEVGAQTVAGNHDVAAARGQSGDGWTHGAIGASTRAYLRALPDRLVVDGITLRHMLASDTRPPERADAATASTSLSFVGHTHVPLLYAVDGVREHRALAPPPDRPSECRAARSS